MMKRMIDIMHDTKRKYGDPIDLVEDYEAYLTLLGIKKKRPRAQSCKDIDGADCPGDSSDSEVINEDKKDEINNKRS